MIPPSSRELPIYQSINSINIGDNVIENLYNSEDIENETESHKHPHGFIFYLDTIAKVPVELVRGQGVSKVEIVYNFHEENSMLNYSNPLST